MLLSTHPDRTLKNIRECVNKSTLRKLYLEMNMSASVKAEKRAKEWLQCEGRREGTHNIWRIVHLRMLMS